ncbi:hypothetical protein TNCV_2103391 [Trichonephila clavipes]|nr:hypothetical protein TNCV_2103391 [Trichonephila clavipes]
MLKSSNWRGVEDWRMGRKLKSLFDTRSSLGYQSLQPTGLGRVDEDMASQVGFFMASLGYQSLPPTGLGRVDEDMASPNWIFHC